MYSHQKFCNHSNSDPAAFLLIIADKTFAESTLQAFGKCDVDGVYGVSKKEVMECKEEFCEKLNILCPTLHEFEFFDEDGNGLLTLEEYFNYTWGSSSLYDEVFGIVSKQNYTKIARNHRNICTQ